MPTLTKSSNAPPRSNAVKLVLFPFLSAHIIFPVLWLVVIAQDGPRQIDWRHFQVAAEQFVSGNWADLYTERLDAVHPGYFWRYPPYALYLVAPLAWMTPGWAYGLLAGVVVTSLAAAMVLLARLTRPSEVEAWVLATALSAPALSTLITGQISALLLLCVVAAAVLWTRGRVVAACAVLGLLAIKPNLGIFFGAYVIVRREWRGAAAMVAVVIGMCALALPLGSELWADFIRVSLSNVNVIAQYDPYKMITLRAFLGTVFGDGRIALMLWGVISAVLLAASAWVWRIPGSPVRNLGLVVLLAIAANPYAFFYDALLLVVPATVWWTERDTWRRNRWTLVAVLIASAWCWEQWAHTWREFLKFAGLGFAPPFSLVGPTTALWLLLALDEARVSQSSPELRSREDHGTHAIFQT